MSSIFTHVPGTRSMAALLAFAAVLATARPGLAQEAVEYYAIDAIGSVRVVFDASGNVLGRMDYAPFGEELYTGLFLPSDRFAQLTRDGEAGQDYAQARRYQPRTGRFTSPDPVYAGLFEPQLWNRYTYALNSPGRYVDPSGLFPWFCYGCFSGPAQSAQEGTASGDTGGSGAGDAAAGGEGMLSLDDIHAQETAGYWGWVDNIQTALDAASLAMDATGVGGSVSWVPDVINGLASGATGDWWGLGMSAWAAVPFIGAGGNLARLGRHAPDFASAAGRVVPIPEGRVARVADNGKGMLYQAPGATGNANMFRIMDPTPQYPNGYMRIYNGHGQPINPTTGKPGTQAETHIPLNYTGAIIWPWQ